MLRVVVLSLFLLSYLSAFDILKESKLEELRLDEELLDAQSDKLSKDWISPVVGSYTKSKSSNLTPAIDDESFRISINQPIFKSGGIYYGIKYAKSVKLSGDIANEKKRRELISNAIFLLFEIKSVELEMKKSKLELKNKEIELFTKEELFGASMIEGSALDRAILEKNQIELVGLELESNLNRVKSAFANLSNKDPKELEVPILELVERGYYLDNSIDLALQKSLVEKQRVKRNGVMTTYLPTISLNLDYIDSHRATKRDSYTNVGVLISVPLFDINTKNRVEIEHLEYLKNSLELETKRDEALNSYENRVGELDIIKKRAALAKRSAKKYESLIEEAKDRLGYGEVTEYDIEILENSKSRFEIEIEILELAKNRLLFEIYYEVY